MTPVTLIVRFFHLNSHIWNPIEGYSMSNNFCKKDYPEADSCPDNFRDNLYKMKLGSLKNPMYFMNEGTVLIQVESQVTSRFRSVFQYFIKNHFEDHRRLFQTK